MFSWWKGKTQLLCNFCLLSLLFLPPGIQTSHLELQQPICDHEDKSHMLRMAIQGTRQSWGPSWHHRVTVLVLVCSSPNFLLWGGNKFTYNIVRFLLNASKCNPIIWLCPSFIDWLPLMSHTWSPNFSICSWYLSTAYSIANKCTLLTCLTLIYGQNKKALNPKKGLGVLNGIWT